MRPVSLGVFQALGIANKGTQFEPFSFVRNGQYLKTPEMWMKSIVRIHLLVSTNRSTKDLSLLLVALVGRVESLRLGRNLLYLPLIVLKTCEQVSLMH
jgi:hypothetical protein